MLLVKRKTRQAQLPGALSGCSEPGRTGSPGLVPLAAGTQPGDTTISQGSSEAEPGCEERQICGRVGNLWGSQAGVKVWAADLEMGTVCVATHLVSHLCHSILYATATPLDAIVLYRMSHVAFQASAYASRTNLAVLFILLFHSCALVDSVCYVQRCHCAVVLHVCRCTCGLLCPSAAWLQSTQACHTPQREQPLYVHSRPALPPIASLPREETQ